MHLGTEPLAKNAGRCQHQAVRHGVRHQWQKRAYVAVAHSMLIAIDHILKGSVVFKDLEADYYNQFNKERKINAYLKKLKALGWESSVVAA